MGDLAEFLTARLDEDEAAARAAMRAGQSASAQWTADSSGDGRDEAWGVTDSDDYLVIYHVRAQAADASEEAIAAYIAANDPARVLREVAAKRAILAAHPRVETMFTECGTCHESEDGWAGTVPVQWPCATVRILASAWLDHPDYRQEWRL